MTEVQKNHLNLDEVPERWREQSLKVFVDGILNQMGTDEWLYRQVAKEIHWSMVTLEYLKEWTVPEYLPREKLDEASECLKAISKAHNKLWNLYTHPDAVAVNDTADR